MEGMGDVFSVTEPYLAAAAAGEQVMAYRMDDAYWMDAGTPARLAALNERIAHSGP
jgi:NDP-sugar pyrophosphorylase family protein